jgi:hypothetical protein
LHNQFGPWDKNIKDIKMSLEKSNNDSDTINEYYNYLIQHQTNQSLFKKFVMCNE